MTNFIASSRLDRQSTRRVAPRSLSIIAWAFILFGSLAMLNIAVAFLQEGKLNFSAIEVIISVLAGPTGVGLLRHKRSSRRRALLLLLIGLASPALGLALYAITLVLDGSIMQRTGVLWALSLVNVIVMAGCGWAFQVLKRPEVRDLFDSSFAYASPVAAKGRIGNFLKSLLE